MSETSHICVCICTYQRPEMLRRLLEKLRGQETAGQFTFSIVVADNDRNESARTVVTEFTASAGIATTYCVEPRQNIALVRNKAVEAATGDYIAFIDDDEEPSAQWLLLMFQAIQHFDADGVLAPVAPRFAEPPPEWISRGEIFDRPSPKTGTWLRWDQTRSGNVLWKRHVFSDPANRFHEEYGRGGEDVDFFRRMIAKGMRFVWCAEAVVHELVPPERCRRSYVLKRALLRGRAPYNQGWPVAKSLVAVPTYALVLPVLLLMGQHVFMRVLIRACDHLGRILAFLGVDLVKEQYVTR